MICSELTVEKIKKNTASEIKSKAHTEPHIVLSFSQICLYYIALMKVATWVIKCVCVCVCVCVCYRARDVCPRVGDAE